MVPKAELPQLTVDWLSVLFWYNLTDWKILQSHKLNYFIKQQVMFYTRSDSLKECNTYRK